MYVPRHFAEERTDVLVGLARSAGFGHLVVSDPKGLTSTPLPFLVDDDATRVRAHVARPNPIWRAAPCAALLVVPVSDGYVSPNWYPSKADHGKVVPTWNYEVVHVHARMVAHDDAGWLQSMVRDLTDLHESHMSRPWSVDDAPDDYIDRMVRGIVGLELIVDRLEGKRKLSQNRDDRDRDGAVAALRQTSPPRRTIADAMAEVIDAG